MQDKAYFRHMWPHEGVVHRALVKIYNHFMTLLPAGPKYRFGMLLRKNKHPYSLLNRGNTVVQIGAPRDTLCSGRARAAYFGFIVGKEGKVVVVEPDEKSIAAYQSFKEKQDLNLVLVQRGAWSERTTLTLYMDKAHPATNFTGGTKNYKDKRMDQYEECAIEVDSLDNILGRLSIDNVDLVSITTNGAERRILEGMKNTLEYGVPYVALACTGEGYEEMMKEYGYELYSYDDRGYTFRNITTVD